MPSNVRATDHTDRSRPVLVLQHAKSETLGLIGDALRRAASEVRYVRTFEGQAVPDDPDDHSGLIVMGGPMGVYETNRYPFLLDEMNLIEGFLKLRLPVLGVCLGSQLLAATLGARVHKGRQKEIGWYPVELTTNGKQDRLWQNLPSGFVAYHWHGDAFDLPKQSSLLASSEITPVQAYRYDERAYGVLFHLEVTENHVREMLTEFGDEIQQENLSAERILEEAKDHLEPIEKMGATVFSRWVEFI